ncbi:MAG TPA: cytochrome c [Thermoanaerobaculia bacterium]|nr:cytochrome c [Thermoanaerobaculia bacterium]
MAFVALSLAAGCRQNMHNQAKYIPLRESDMFADGTSARPLPAHTVARGFLRADSGLYTGLARDGKPVPDFPSSLPVTREVLLRGEQRYNIFCSPCHDRAGTGRGMVVQRGYKQPPSFHIDRLRTSPVGYLYNVITEGFGVMPSYASQIPPEDRWAIVAYVRALQLSQNARLADLSPEERQKLDAAFKLPPIRPEDEGPRDGVQAPEPLRQESAGRTKNGREH